jgi:NAD(P)-dependent dehydrogenase (short-subunit alcohol dehydrogenase family)
MQAVPVNPMELTNRRYLVTGAASGIGRATSVLLSGLGATLACVDLNESGLRETGDLLTGRGHVFRTLDLLDLSSIPASISGIAEEIGKLHGFVHAAGVAAPWPLKALSPTLWRKVLAVNTEAAIMLSQAFQKRSIYAGEHGSIVFISSVIARAGSPAASAYAMTKAALEGLARCLALELARVPIRVNCVAPGFVRTPMLDRMDTLWGPEQLERVEALHPLGFGRPHDIACAAAFLLADTARWITGSVLIADGGYTAQ